MVKPDFVPFDDLNNVPEAWRSKYLTEARVSLEQWNAIMEYAHDNAAASLDEQGNPVSYAPAYALAYSWFREHHKPYRGLWVPKGGEEQ